jgi:hypothetical protein
MDRKQFEDLVRKLTQGTTRRGVLGILAAVAGFRLAESEAKQRRRGKNTRRKSARANRRGNARVSAEKSDNAATPYHLPDECFPGPFPYETCLYDQRGLIHRQSTPSGKQHTYLKGQVCYRVTDPATGQLYERWCSQGTFKEHFDPETGSGMTFYRDEFEQLINNYRYHGETIYRLKDGQAILYRQCFTLTNLITGEVEFEQCFDINEVTICHFDQRSGAYEKLVVSAKQAEQHFKQHERDSYFGNCCDDAECADACCTGVCSDLDRDRSNCGRCGNPCGPLEVCCGGGCESVACNPPCASNQACRPGGFNGGECEAGVCCTFSVNAEYACVPDGQDVRGCAPEGDCAVFDCQVNCGNFGFGTAVGVSCADAQSCSADGDCPDGASCRESSCCGQSVCVASCNGSAF